MVAKHSRHWSQRKKKAVSQWNGAHGKQNEMALVAYGLPSGDVVDKAQLFPVFWI